MLQIMPLLHWIVRGTSREEGLDGLFIGLPQSRLVSTEATTGVEDVKKVCVLNPRLIFRSAVTDLVKRVKPQCEYEKSERVVSCMLTWEHYRKGPRARIQARIADTEETVWNSPYPNQCREISHGKEYRNDIRLALLIMVVEALNAEGKDLFFPSHFFFLLHLHHVSDITSIQFGYQTAG